MCGISGLINFNNERVEESDLKILSDTISHRGPDSQGFYIKGKIGLAHNRLSIVDLSDNGKQPMYSSSQNSIIVFNGEVYNWRELRKEFEKKNWKSNTDTEVILELYEKYGIDFISKLNGIFSFVIYDLKTGDLILCRDRLGVKPLFFFKDSERLIFSSEIKSLIKSRFVKNKINYESIKYFLLHGLIDHNNETFFENINHIDPGSYLIIKKNNNIIKKKYWNLYDAVNLRLEQSNFENDDEYIDEFNHYFEDSINLQSRSDVKIGTALSSGIDSSIITYFLTKKIKNFETFTYGFTKNSETSTAKKNSSFLNLKHNENIFYKKNFEKAFFEVIKSQEMPITSIRCIAMHEMYKNVKNRGIKVILEGQGGDEIGAGYEYYHVAYFLDQLKETSYTNAYKKFSSFLKRYKKINKNNKFEKIFNSLIYLLKPGVSTQDGVPFVNHDVYNKEFTSTFKKFDDDKYPFKSHLKNAQLLDTTKVVLPRALRYLDRASMNSSVEARVPFLDHRLLELAFMMPERLKIDFKNQKKNIIGVLNKQKDFKFIKQINLQKKTIVDPQKQMLRKDMKKWILDLFENDENYAEFDIFDKKKLLLEYKKFCAHPNPETSFHIFQYINVIIWLKIFFKN